MIFPPGCARLETSPVPTGSEAEAITMGIVALAFLAANVAPGLLVTMTSTLSGPVRLQGQAAVRLSLLHNGTQ